MDNFQSKADLFSIRLNFDETGTIVQMPLELHNSIEALAQEEDNKLGLNLHCYSNDDYIFLRYMIHHAYTTYKKMSIDPTTLNWIDGCCDIPQIVVHMIEKPALATDENNELILDDNGMYVPDDRKLNAGIGGPYFYENKPYYVFQFNRYMLQRFAIFLQEVFDKNEELVISFDNSKFEFIDGSISTAEDVFPHFDLTTKKELLKKAQDLYQVGLHDLGYALIKQSTHMDDNEQVPDPNVTFWKNPETGKEQLIGFSYADRNSNKFYIPIRKTIYNTSGFFNYFIRRNTLIAELFVEAIRMIVYHEFFHIANGHGLLSKADSSYTSQKDVSVCIEQNADDSAMRMMVCELLFDTLDGNPGSMQLKYSRKEIIHTWAIRIFAGYLALSWMYRGNDRKWDQKMIEEYIKTDGLTHPLYQFRTFNIINCALNRLQDIAKSSEMKLITADGILIDETLIGEVISTTNDLLNSFESSFCMTYDDNRSMEEKILQSWKAEKSSIPQVPQEVPFLMALLSDHAAAEAEKIQQIWPELNNRLKEVGAYNIRFSKI